MYRRTATLALLAVVAACTETPPPTALEGPPLADAISDAVHDQGNPNFFFLPPMVPAPAPEGVFDGGQSPAVEICVWDGSGCGPSLEIYTTDTGPGSETIRVDPDQEQYVVNWNTDDILGTVPLDESAGESYRIRVLVGSLVLGYADVQVVENGSQLKNVETGAFIPLLDGRTLPIKFRIEEGFDTHGNDQLVSAGRLHSCALASDGDAYCWGYNRQGQLGGGFTSYASASPVKVLGGHAFASVSAGAFHSCGVTVEGQGYCWGYNVYGQLGDGNVYRQATTPQPVAGGYTFVSIAAAEYTTCGLTTDGQGLCWGRNDVGQLGDGSIYYFSALPVTVTGGHTFQSIDMTFRHACGLTLQGQAYCWGSDYRGQLGQGSTATARPTPVLVPGLTFASVDAGGRHSCGLTPQGEAYCWGENFAGALGIGDFSPNWPYVVPTPTPVAGGLTFRNLSAGTVLTCATTADGTGYCWGHNVYGSVGDGTTTPAPVYGKPSPTAVAGGHTFSWISAGVLHACGVTTDADTYCWGYNLFSQAGPGPDAQPDPTFILNLDPAVP